MTPGADKPVRDTARRIADLIESGDPSWPVANLYHEEAESIEPKTGIASAAARITKGKADLAAKHRAHDAESEFVSAEVTGIYLHDEDGFALTLRAVARDRATGEVAEYEEVATYELRDGLILRERFYILGGA